MADLVASPKKNLIYSVTSPRLAAQVHHQLLILKGKQTKDALAVFSTNVETLLSSSIYRVALSGYVEGAKAVDQVQDAAISLRIARESKARALQAVKWITETTGVALDITAGMSKVKAISEGRADVIAVNELSLAFFGGTRYGWGLDKKARKTWELSSMHDQDDICDDNADEGPISINDAFQSGDFIPPAHIKCECELGLWRFK